MKLHDLREGFVAEKNLLGKYIKDLEVSKYTPSVKWEGDFNCFHMDLTSLRYSPGKVDGKFDCSNNQLTSLEHGPSAVNGGYDCGLNHLIDLTGAPKVVVGTFDCGMQNGDSLTSLKGGPVEIRPVHGQAWFFCNQNPNLISLEGAPRIIQGSANFSATGLTSLHDVHKIIKELHGDLDLRFCSIRSHVLGLLYVKGLESIDMREAQAKNHVATILNRYLKIPVRTHRDVIACQSELLDAGYDEYAQL